MILYRGWTCWFEVLYWSRWINAYSNINCQSQYAAKCKSTNQISRWILAAAAMRGRKCASSGHWLLIGLESGTRFFSQSKNWSNHKITFYKWLKQNTVLDCVPVLLRVTYGKWGTAVLTFESVPDEPLTWLLRWNLFYIAAPSYHVIAGIQFNPLSPNSV